MKKINIGLLSTLLLTACAPHHGFAPVQDATLKPGSSPQASPYHVVRRGDTLYSIAWAYEIDYRTLARLNNLPPPYGVHVGQQIRIVAAGQRGLSPMGPRQQIVTAADSTTPLISDTAEVSRPRIVASEPLPLMETPQPMRKPVSMPSYSDIKPQNTNQKGGLGWRWPTKGPVISPYAQANHHKGIDIGGQPGQLIYASAKGSVAYAGNGLRGYGNLIILKHNSEFLSAYAHNSQLLVKEGQMVNAGDPIAKMGNTESALTKLHFEIRRSGGTINPMQYLPHKVG